MSIPGAAASAYSTETLSITELGITPFSNSRLAGREANAMELELDGQAESQELGTLSRRSLAAGCQGTRSADKAPAVQTPVNSSSASTTFMQGWGRMLMYLLGRKDEF